jgi:hypothetical protein
MKKIRTSLSAVTFVFIIAWAAVLFPANPAENREITFAPAEPAPGQKLLFTASHFHTPNLLKWNMGDGTVLTSGGNIAKGQDATLAYSYPAAGQYLVKVYDDGGNTDLPPVTVQVTVTSSPRALLVDPEPPLAGQAAVITAVNFRTPEKIAWDLGDGTAIEPGPGPAVVIASFQVSHVYEKAGTYVVKAYDNNGDRSQAPQTLTVRVAQAPAINAPVIAAPQAAAPEVKVVKEPAAVSPVLVAPAPAVETSVPRSRKYPMIKIGPYAGYFRPQDMLVKQIYGEGDVIYGGRLGVHLWKGFYLWLSASQFKIISKTTFSEDKTTLTLLSANVFLRYGLRLGFFSPYAGIGFTRLNFKEESALGNVTGNGTNTAYEGGFEIRMNRNFVLDLGARYDTIKVNPTGFEIDLGGLQAGIALLLSF